MRQSVALAIQPASSKPKAMTRTQLFLGLSVAAAAFACGGTTTPTVKATVSPLTFTSGSTVTVSVETTDFEIRAPPGTMMHQGLTAGHASLDAEHDDTRAAGEEHIANEGHFHVYLDTTMESPLEQSFTKTAMFPVVASPGAHKLIVRLNDDMHKFLVPEVKVELDITVQ